MPKKGTAVGKPTASIGPLAGPDPYAAAIYRALTNPAPAPPPEPAPVAPEPVVPFPTSDDMRAVNEWLTNWQIQLEDIDFGISQQTIDTGYQKEQTKRQATAETTAADDAMAARGIFRSSLRDAAVYDIAATKALADNYLDSKLQSTISAGSTRKDTLATAKTNFEAAMIQKYGENAKVVNDALNAGYAEALANYKPPQATAPSPGVAGGAPVAVASRPQPSSRPPVPVGSGRAQPSPNRPNTASGTGGTRARDRNPRNPRNPRNR